MISLIQPPFLKQNDQVALIATAKSIDQQAMQPFCTMVEGWRLQLVEGKNLFNVHHQFAGTDQERAYDLQQALDNKNIKAVFCARGGYGTSRIIDLIDFTQFKSNPKWVVGFSDITLLHCHINRLGYQSLHASMPILFGKPGYSLSERFIEETLFGKPISLTLPVHPLNRIGHTQGILVGGNLTLLHTIIQTASEQDFNNKILFIEDVGEYLYHLDRMMVHLKRMGAFRNLKGLIVGHFTDMKDNDTPFGKNVSEIIYEAVQDYNFPVAFGFPTGHEPSNLPLICGAAVQLKVTEKEILFSHVPNNQNSLLT